MEDKFKKMERTLYDYRKLDTAINNIDIDIEHLKNDITLKGISYEQRSSPTNAFSSEVENEVVKREQYLDAEINRLLSLKADKMALRAKIYNALKDLDEVERKLIELRYFTKRENKKSWIAIGMELNFNKDYCQQLRNKIINNLIDMVFP